MDLRKNLLTIAEHYEEAGEYRKASELYASALSVRERKVGLEHASLAEELYNLGLIYFVLDDFDKAEDTLLRALAIQRRALGPSHPEALETLNVLAMVSSGDAVVEYDVPMRDSMSVPVSSLIA